MQDLSMADKLIEGAIVSIGQTAMDMRVILKQEKIELYFGLGVHCLVDDAVD